MSELKYDEEFPYVVVNGNNALARHENRALAEAFIGWTGNTYMEVVDTTPKPKIPEDAEFIVVGGGDVTRDIYQKMPDKHEPEGYYWFRALDTMAYGAGEMDDMIGDSKVIVLVRKESE